MATVKADYVCWCSLSKMPYCISQISSSDPILYCELQNFGWGKNFSEKKISWHRKIVISKTVQHSFSQCYLTIKCISSLTMNSKEIKQVHPWLLLLSPFFRNCVLKQAILKMFLGSWGFKRKKIWKCMNMTPFTHHEHWLKLLLLFRNILTSTIVSPDVRAQEQH